MHPNFAGTWKMKSSENFDELLKALGVNAMLRKVAGAAAAKPHVEIRQDGEQFYIKTSTSVRTTEINFHIGQEFDEETVDGRKCKSLATWETENKIYCKQTLVDGDGPKTYWSRELKGEELILVRMDGWMNGWMQFQLLTIKIQDKHLIEKLSLFLVHSTPVKFHKNTVERLGVAGRSAGDEPFMPFSHQPLGGVGGHVPTHVLLQPSVQPGLEALVQPCAHMLV
ncbi:hypothetical protein QTP86_027590 [Hemibagrus guttatus]|nr:hypothetical protein QTP86_027590 [Hemibagrus guttatus]